jgi:DNA polymerase III delta prime subunit
MSISTSTSTSTPWVEKYRPTNFSDIVLDAINQRLLNNIITNGYFPNLLFYGPPGTGKTTTIINIVNAYQSKNSSCDGIGNVIHLNASDERGIDVIRNQLNSFVNTKSLFCETSNQLKFIILDEADYMTKNAQIALKYLLNSYTKNVACRVKFCLICNYVSKIDESLQSEFVRVRFNQLPEAGIFRFLNQINNSEKLNLSDESVTQIQRRFGSDIRSMINFMQSNQHALQHCKILKNDVWEDILAEPNAAIIVKKFYSISKEYGIEIRNLIKYFLNHNIRLHTNRITGKFLNSVEHIMHNQECNPEYVLNYFSLNIVKWANDQGGPKAKL